MTTFNFERLKQVGFSVRCCEVCIFSRFYEKKSSWGLCAKHGSNEEPLRIHKLGRCRRGFKPDAKEATKRGLNVLGEFM